MCLLYIWYTCRRKPGEQLCAPSPEPALPVRHRGFGDFGKTKVDILSIGCPAWSSEVDILTVIFPHWTENQMVRKWVKVERSGLRVGILGSFCLSSSKKRLQTLRPAVKQINDFYESALSADYFFVATALSFSQSSSSFSNISLRTAAKCADGFTPSAGWFTLFLRSL